MNNQTEWKYPQFVSANRTNHIMNLENEVSRLTVALTEAVKALHEANDTCKAHQKIDVLKQRVERLEGCLRDTGSKLTLDNDKQVFFYEQDFYVLSNFSSFRVDVFGRDFQTAEHAYHWKKFSDTATGIAHAIRHSSSAHEAFKIAEVNKGLRRKDWDAVKLDVMREIIKAKTTRHEYVRRKLLATGDRELIENSWRDSFWGWGENRDGQNMLGKLWMEVRASLISDKEVVSK